MQPKGMPRQDIVDLNLYEWEPDPDIDADWVATILLHVQNGALDTYLRQLAQVTFARRDLLLGHDAQALMTHNVQRVTPDITPPTSLRSTVIATATYDNDGVLTGVSPIPAVALPGVKPSDIITVNGKSYYRRDVIGQTVRLIDNRPRGTYTGLRAKVLGYKDYVKIEWIDKPVKSRSQRIKDAEFIFIVPSYIQHIFK